MYQFLSLYDHIYFFISLQDNYASITLTKRWKKKKMGNMSALPIEKKLYSNRFYKEHKNRNSMWKELCENFLQKFISPQDVVLDLPTGYGEFINNIHCKKKIATDINPDSKKFVKSNVTFLLGRSTKISLKNSTVDKIFISNFFEHITHEEITKTIKECYRILKSSGQVIVLQPNIRFCSKDYWMFFDHITPIDDRGLTEAFEIARLRQIYKIEKFLPFTTKSAVPQHPLLIRLYLLFPFLWVLMGKQSFLIFEKQ